MEKNVQNNSTRPPRGFGQKPGIWGTSMSATLGALALLTLPWTPAKAQPSLAPSVHNGTGILLSIEKDLALPLDGFEGGGNSPTQSSLSPTANPSSSGLTTLKAFLDPGRGPNDSVSLAAQIDLDIRKKPIFKQIEDGSLYSRFKYEIRNQFYQSGHDTLAPIRPQSMNPELEYTASKATAASLKDYIVYKSLPKFFLSRPQTESLGQRYEKALSTVSESTRIEQRAPESKIAYSFGVNPLAFAGWAEVSDPKKSWSLSATVDDVRVLNPRIQAMTKFGGVNQYILSSVYVPFSKTVVPGFTWEIEKDILTGSVGTELNFAAPVLADAMNTTVSLGYRF